MTTLLPAWKELVEQTKDDPYGHSFSHETVAAILKIKARTTKYYQQVQLWRRAMLADYDRHIESVRTRGYRIVEPKEHHRAMRIVCRQAGRRIKKAQKIGEHANQDFLTHEERRRVIDATAKMASLAGIYKRTLTETRPSLPISKLPDMPKMLSDRS